MHTTKPVDILQECSALFHQEDTLAYFDFQLAGAPVEGLCRIARPKKVQGGQEYVALVFVVDTPDGPTREQALAGLKPLGSGALEQRLPEIALVVSVPPAKSPPQVYIKQCDIMLKERFAPSPEFLSQRLHPALTAVLGLSSGELCWWDAVKKEKPAAPAASAAEMPAAKSFIARLQEKLFG